MDYNWEYPGYVFGRGYDEQQLLKDKEGFAKLLVRNIKMCLNNAR